MGLNDAQEMLDACKEQTAADERRLIELEREQAALKRIIAAHEHRIAAIRQLAAASTTTVGGHEVVATWRLERILDDPDPAP